ncbi:MAG: aspartyl protease family protein [Acidobacteria bacterium]|nr:aspartyl protease family protein [Acidobacteriota bacterium]
MNCRRCRTENPDTSRYCAACGALLTRPQARQRRTTPWYVLAGAAALLILIAGYFLLPGLRPTSRRAESKASVAEPAAQGSVASKTVESIPAPASLALVAGRFALEGLWEGAPASLESALFDGSWAALPLWAFLSSGSPRLDSPGPSGLRPAWVDWKPANPVVLCSFDLSESLKTPELSPYDESAILEWRPLAGERTSFAIETGPLRQAGSFKAFALFNEITAPGVLVQEGRVVGWTFGQGIASGYLWAPPDGAGPKPLLPASDLAGTLLAAGREAMFVRAMSMTDEVASDRKLTAFAAGFRGQALLSPEDLPLHLKPAMVVARMSSLATAMIERGMAAEVGRILDPDILSAAGDISLIKAAARAAGETRGYDAAHRLLVDLRRRPVIQGAPAYKELEAVEVELAKASLHKILNERGYNGLEIFEEASPLAPDDLELHLLGVEVAVLEKKWGRASDLLRAKQYPTALSDKARTLERLVEEGRRDEESATIRFNPGDKLIPVYAVINKKLRQKFFIDTGATSSIIPTSAVAALGIKIDSSTPVVGLQGVAGGDLAYQVRLESIEVEGQTVFDIRAIVYDLGMDEEAGLLGNDFLQYFQVDLDSIKGVLKLRKK